MKTILFTLLGIMLISALAHAKGDPKKNRQQFMDTCTKAYQDIAETNLQKSRASTKAKALERCNTAAGPMDYMKSWDIQDDTKLGCDIGVRFILKDYPNLGSADNLNDWKKYYGASCGDW